MLLIFYDFSWFMIYATQSLGSLTSRKKKFKTRWIISVLSKRAGNIEFGLAQVTAYDAKNEGWFELKKIVTHVKSNF